MSSRTKLIINPIANLGRAWAESSELRSRIESLDYIDWSVTTNTGHATELAKQAACQGYDLVVAAGGDGTMHEVLNGLMQLPAEDRPCLGVLPVGSGNDFAYANNISPDPNLALDQILNGQPTPIDIGCMSFNGQSCFFGNAIGIGFDTIVTVNSRRFKNFKGFAIYFLAVLQTMIFNYEPFHLKMQVDGEPWEKTLLMLALMNGKREGGGFHVTPHALPDDGKLDIMSIDKVNRLRMLRILPEVMKGTQFKLPDCTYRQLKHISISSDRPLYIHADGEITSTPVNFVTQLAINIIENAIQVVR